ncbi:MAG: hypothetical protein CL561_12575 [Alphaproteobacteria bacterium]|nr:hypothetical protein [Alphaproteobacteria bacterium]
MLMEGILMDKPDSYHRHEALHMSAFLAECVESQIVDNLFIQSDQACLELATQANQILAELYQLIGKTELNV